MSKILHLLIISLLIQSSLTSTLKVICSFSLEEFKSVGEIYTCESSEFLASTDSPTLTFETLHTSSNYTNSDVKGFKIDGHSLVSFPQSIEKTFANLIAIYINDGTLSKVTQSDLKPFPLLRYLDLFDNKIEVIEKDLFKFNPNLEVIWLSNNKIRLIDPNVFDHLTKLNYLYLMDNACIRQSETNRTDIMRLIRNVKTLCSGSEIITTTENPRFRNFSQLQRQFVEQANKLKKCEVNLDEAHMMMDAMTLASKIGNMKAEDELKEVSDELEKMKHTKNVLYFFVTLLVLVVIGFGVLVYRRKESGGGYARGFMM